MLMFFPFFSFCYLRLLLALIMLEHQCGSQKGEEICPPTISTPSTPTRTVPNIMGNSLKYIPGAAIPQQPMFLASILSALQLVNANFAFIVFFL